MSAAESTIAITLDMETQRRILNQARAVMKAAPMVRPTAVGGLPMSVRITSAGDLGWVANGAYSYAPKDSRGYPWPRIPGEWIEIANRAVAADPRHDGRDVAWDSAILNWYDVGAKLGPHRDQQEHDRTRPIVTISIGYSARWFVEVERHGFDELGRATLAFDRSRCRLPSGAVTVLAGETRDCMHAVEGLILPESDSQASLFGAPEPSPIADERGAVVPGRLSITLREAGIRRC
jgi:alkylated DNA repair protein (DNA oxidative demethylase)